MKKIASNIFEAFEEVSSQHFQKEVVCFKENSHYTCLTYKDLHAQITKFSGFLAKNNIKKGDKVALIIENNPYWPIAFLSLMSLGAVAVPLNPQLELQGLSVYIEHSEAKCILTLLSSYSRIKEILANIGVEVIALDAAQVLKETEAMPAQLVKEKVNPDDLACILYTSGTTSVPKGVMLTHQNLLANIASLKKLNLITSADGLIAILPFYHAYPFMVTLLLPLLVAGRVSIPLYVEAEEIMDCIKKTGVTIFVGVPRVFTLFYQRIKKTTEDIFILKRITLSLLLDVGLILRRYLKINLAKIVLKDLHSCFGKDFRFMVSGGAKLKKEVSQAFYKWGFLLLEGYGLSEASPVVSFGQPHDFKIGSVGKAIPEVKIKIDQPDKDGIGEILISGSSITPGYFKQKDVTDKTIRQGWLYSGDMGYVDKQGFIYIVGRKKELIVLSSGKKINPEGLEDQYSKSPFIEEICIFLPQGIQDKDVIAAAIVPNYRQFRAQQVQQVKDKIRYEIENISKGLPAYKRIKKYVIIDEHLPRTILGKIKRYEVESKYNFVSYKREKTTQVLAQDKDILASPICQKALQYLEKRLKKTVRLDDHLELDLGFDSLEQIELVLGFQKVTGIRISDENILGIFTVRDVLSRLYELSKEKRIAKVSSSTQWQEILNQSPPAYIRASISIHQNLLKKILGFLASFCLNIFTRAFFLLQVKNQYNLPKKAPYILTSNHCSYLDGIIIAASISPFMINQVYFLGFSKYFRHPLIAWAAKLYRFISIDPIFHLVESMQACSYILKNSKVLCMFPEGIRSPDGKVKEFKKGVGILAKELDIPIVPVYISGTFTAWSRHRILPRPAKVKVIFGKKTTISELLPKDFPEANAYQIIVDDLRTKVIELSKLTT